MVLLVRFGLIVGGVVVLALVVYAIALILKRRGRLDEARRRAAPAARAAARVLENRSDRPRRIGGSSRTRGGLAGTAVRAAARYLDEDRRGPRDRGARR